MSLLGIIKINTNHNHSKKLILTEISCYFCLYTTCNEKSFPGNFRFKNKQFLLINATFWYLVNLHKWYHDRQNFWIENPSFSTLRIWFSLKSSNLHTALEQQHLHKFSECEPDGFLAPAQNRIITDRCLGKLFCFWGNGSSADLLRDSHVTATWNTQI